MQSLFFHSTFCEYNTDTFHTGDKNLMTSVVFVFLTDAQNYDTYPRSHHISIVATSIIYNIIYIDFESNVQCH